MPILNHTNINFNEINKRVPGIRMGEMEQDTIRCHGIYNLLNDFSMQNSDINMYDKFVQNSK